jgi:hypothetical protein
MSERDGISRRWWWTALVGVLILVHALLHVRGRILTLQRRSHTGSPTVHYISARRWRLAVS